MCSLRLRMIGLVAGAGLAVALPAASFGQAAPSGGAGTAPQSPSIVREGRRHLAASIARIAVVNLRLAADPNDDDYRLAAEVLDFARELEPESADLIRQQMQASFLAGEEARALDLSSAALKLDPTDTVTQLRRITASIGRNNQTIEDRVKVYDQFVADKRIDPAIKSRLALDAALLVRERGDERGFLTRLSNATSLDSSHKAAAYMAASYVLDRLEDPVGRVDARINLVMSDPMDPQVQMDLARELAFHGAFVSAQRFHTNALRIFAASGVQAPLDPALEREALRWQVEGPAAVVAAVDQALRIQQGQHAAAIADRVRRKQPHDDIMPPEDVRLTPEIARIGLIAAYAVGDQVSFEASRQRLIGDLVKRLNNLRDPLLRGSLSEREAQEVGLDIALFIQTTRLAVGLDPESVQRDIDSVPALQEKYPDRVNQLRVWIKLRKGQYAEAIADFQAWPEPNSFMEFGHGLALELSGETSAAIAQYRRTNSMFPLDIYGAWARTRALAIGDSARVEVGEKLDGRVAQQVPDWLDRMVTRPEDFVSLRASVVDGGDTVVDPIVIRLSIRNLAPIPLSFGSDGTISSSLLLAPRAEMRQAGLDGNVVPEVVEIDRRLRLMPREELVVDVRPDLAQSGWALEALGTRTVRMRWRVIQAFQPEPDRGGFRPRAFGQTAETGPVTRRPLPEAALGAERYAAAIGDAPANALYRLAASIRGSIMLPVLGPGLVGPDVLKMQPGINEEGLKPVAAALVTRYPTLEPAHRAHLAAILPPARLAPGMEAFDEIVRGDKDPLVMAIALVTRVTDENDPMITAAKESSDERLRVMAGVLPAVLKRQQRSYSRIDAATLGAEIASITPPSQNVTVPAAAPGQGSTTVPPDAKAPDQAPATPAPSGVAAPAPAESPAPEPK